MSSCGKTQTAQAEEVRTADITTVAVAKAGVEDISHEVVLTAEFKPFQEIDVMAKVAGYVKKINVDVGDRVKEGQLLAVIEIPEMADDQARAQSMLNRSQAEVARARDELQRAESSHKIAHLSYTRLADVAKQKAGPDRAAGDRRRAEQGSGGRSAGECREDPASPPPNSRCRSAQAEVQKVKTLFDYTRVTAPFAGVITKRYADTGFHDPGGHLVEHAGDAAGEAVGKQPAALDSSGSRVRRADRAHRAAG